jgi:alkaline phosphatase
MNIRNTSYLSHASDRSATNRFRFLVSCLATASIGLSVAAQDRGSESSSGHDDVVSRFQAEAIATKTEKKRRPWHFGSQGRGEVYSNHTSHSNRLIPVYTFGSKIRLADVTGANSLYRDAGKVKALYGYDAPNTFNPQAEYCDQTDVYRLQKDAVARGVKHLFVVWFDGMDYEATQAAAVAKSGAVYTAGKGQGLVFQDYAAGGTAGFGYFVTSPSHNSPTKTNVDLQRIEFAPNILRGGYDADLGGPNPWTTGRFFAAAQGYLKGQGGNAADKKGVLDAGRLPHAYTDSSTSAASAFNGIKSFNNGLNVSPDGKPVDTLWHELQTKGWKLGTATSVPFNHASPAATYARNVYRDDYQDIAREMLGLQSVIELTNLGGHHDGLDVILGAGASKEAQRFEHVKSQGENSADGTTYLATADKKAASIEHGGKYVVVERTSGKSGKELLAQAAERAAAGDHRLFGVFGTQYGNLPFRTTDGDYKPSPGIRGTQKYADADLIENPTLSDMTRAALKVLSKDKGKPFALFVEAGDVDFALHDNNLDSAIGAVFSGEEAIRAIIAWVEANSNWDESAMIVTADHGHSLVIDDLNVLAGTAKDTIDPRETP